MGLLDDIDRFVEEVNSIEIKVMSLEQTKKNLIETVNNLKEQNKICADDLDVLTNAVTILRDTSDEAVKETYRFIEENLNIALERIFADSVRKIKLVESTRMGLYPQLDIELTVENGRKRQLEESGHGLSQIVSWLSILCIIVITGSRRLFIMDEVLSGLSARARSIVTDIMWTFSEIGFQFVTCERGFIPKGANVVELKLTNGVASVRQTYIEENGVYLGGSEDAFSKDIKE